MPNPALVAQQMNHMERGIREGKARKRNVASALYQGTDEAEMAAAARARGWRMAQVGEDFIFAPGNYVIRPIV